MLTGARPRHRATSWAVITLLAAAAACGDGGSSTAAGRPAGVPDGAQKATVVGSVDADTVKIALPGGAAAGVEVSVIGAVRPVPGECLVAEADAFAAQELVAGSTVYLLSDTQDAGPDGALLRYLWVVSGAFYNDEVLRQGFVKMAPASANQRFQRQLAEAEAEAQGASRGVWGCPAAPTSAPPATSAPKSTTTMPAATVPRSTSAPTTSPPATSPATTTPQVRTVSLGETFSLGVGQSVSVAGEGLSLTFGSVVSDNRCPIGAQCIVAGSAVITVAVSKAGAAPATLTLATDAPTSAQYGGRSVELVRLSRGTPTATLRVT